MLATAAQETGLAIVTEVMAPEHVPIVAEYADVLQIGARNMQNYQLLQAVGDSGKPALLKRGMSATLDEFLLAAEYILDRNNPNVMLCERGIRTYEDHTRFTLPLATVPYLHEKSHLPVVVDPSHGTGKARLVAPMARAAIAAGCRRADRRGARRPRARRQRRRPDDHAGGVQADDGSVPADCGGGGSDDLMSVRTVVINSAGKRSLAATAGRAPGRPSP